MEKSDNRGFLVITRREYERVLIKTPLGEVVEIVVKRIKGAQVRIGVGAPKSFDVKRADPRMYASVEENEKEFTQELFV